MKNITPIKPSFIFGYWRPWKKDANLLDSYFDYVKDVSLVKYGADLVGQYIKESSKEQVEAINQLGEIISGGLNLLSDQISEVNESLLFINRNLDIQIEQQRLTNLLLEDIVELLRVPESEKKRMHSIELGIKFFVNASSNSDLFADSLEEFLKAESLMKQDYFVLHRIGCIYLYVEKFIDPVKAIDYFSRAGKYAEIESDIDAVHLVNVLIKDLSSQDFEDEDNLKDIGLLAADSYQKAAFAAYVLGRFDEAVNFQKKALRLNNVPEISFILAKYQVRNNNVDEALVTLDHCINESPIFAPAIFKEIDLINEPKIINLVASKNEAINDKLNKLITTWKESNLPDNEDIIFQIKKLLTEPYEIKIQNFNKLTIEAIEEVRVLLEHKVDVLIEKVSSTLFITFDKEKINQILAELEGSKKLSSKILTEVLSALELEIQNDEVKIGSRYAGGIVFYLDDKGNGLVVAEKNFEKAIWADSNRYYFNFNNKGVSYLEKGIGNGAGMKNTKKIVDYGSIDFQMHLLIWKSKYISIPTSARICMELNHNGFTDWYLPTIGELELLYENLSRLSCLDFDKGIYWSSTEWDWSGHSDTGGSGHAYVLNTENPERGYSTSGNITKYYNFFAIREFYQLSGV
jgi:tetratricopeptide (TPR) repeat protein